MFQLIEDLDLVSASDLGGGGGHGDPAVRTGRLWNGLKANFSI